MKRESSNIVIIRLTVKFLSDKLDLFDVLQYAIMQKCDKNTEKYYPPRNCPNDL